MFFFFSKKKKGKGRPLKTFHCGAYLISSALQTIFSETQNVSLSLSLRTRVGRKADVVAVEDFTGKEAKERMFLRGQGARGGEGDEEESDVVRERQERCAQKEHRGG